MRTFMTLLTLGAAGTGYVYLQQTSSISEPNISRRFDWGRSLSSGAEASRLSVDQLRGRIRERTRSVLDSFANQQGGHSDAPLDDAFQRLKQLTQSAVAVASRPEPVANLGFSGESLSQVPQPDLDELQRTAFDPSFIQANPINLITNQVKATDDVKTAEASPPPTVRPAAAALQEAVDHRKPENVSSERSTRTTPAPIAEKAVTEVSRVIAQNSAPKAPVKPTTKRDAQPLTADWKVIGKTTEGRPMHSMHLGQQGTRTLVIAGLNGDDRTAVYWLERLADELKKRPELFDSNEIVLFRAGNPDGLVKNQRNNARGVPLNRNFPSRRYRPNGDMPQYAVPASEVETRVLLETFYSFRPRRVIHLTSTTGSSMVMHNRLAKNLAEELSESMKMAIQPLDAEQFPGSVEDFSDGTLEAAVFSMRLGIGNDWKSSWTTVRPQIVSAAIGRSIESSKGAVAATTTADPDRTPIPSTPVEPVSRRPRRSGYEELPAPPF